MIAILVGLAFLVLGFYGVAVWLPDFITVIKGFGSLSLILGGVLAVIFGVASVTPKRTDGRKEK